MQRVFVCSLYSFGLDDDAIHPFPRHSTDAHGDPHAGPISRALPIPDGLPDGTDIHHNTKPNTAAQRTAHALAFAGAIRQHFLAAPKRAANACTDPGAHYHAG